jgi:sugar transferase (PEP-CTERM system associated)
MLRIGNHHISKIKAMLFVTEAVILVASAYLAALIRFANGNAPSLAKLTYFPLSAGLFCIAILLSMTAFGMYQFSFKVGFRETLLRLVPAFVVGLIGITTCFYLLPDLYFGRGILGLVAIIAGTGILLVRVIFYHSSEARLMESRVLFVGHGELAKECFDLVVNNPSYHRYNVVGFLPMPGETCCIQTNRILRKNGRLVDIAKKYEVSEVLVAVQDRRNKDFSIEDLLECKLSGIKVTDAASFIEREACQIRVDHLQPSWLVFGNGFDQGYMRAFCKRAFDLIVSIIIFTVSIPAMALTSLLIYLEDRGPIFYRQERIGMDGLPYMVLKFRSMGVNAENGNKPQWASANDPRTTRVGSIIRKLRIDELPQIINVLKGEMSFVGPRPERPYFVVQLCEQIPFYSIRHSIKPGITGMAQVRYPYGSSVADAVQKLQYDLYYVKNNSLFLDMLILIDTLQVVLLGKGAR